jgi:hypothetical protein
VAAQDAEYHHGEMQIAEQERTFRGFVRTTLWSCELLALTLVFLTLKYSVGLDWFTSLGVSFVLGVLIGLGLGMKGAWYAALVGLGALMAIIGVIAAILTALLG